ncbi:MAG: NAD-dependent epimerase/dehydratase family protein [Myxococcota bacterium]
MEGQGRLALVTGGAGFIGGHLCEGLVAAGWQVRVLDDLSSGSEANLAEVADRVELIEADLCDSASLARALKGVQVVFHHAAVASVARSVAEPQHSHRVNLTGTLLLLDEARRAGVHRLVYAASASVYGATPPLPTSEGAPVSPASPYALQKYAGERYCGLYYSLYGFETVALRYFNVYGPRQDPASDYAAVIPCFARACLAEEDLTVYGDGEQTRDFVMVEDAVRANLKAADSRAAAGTVCNVAAGRRSSLNEVIEHFRALLGTKVAAHYEAPRLGDVRDSHACLQRARELLGYEPRVGLRDGLRQTLAAMHAADPASAGVGR